MDLTLIIIVVTASVAALIVGALIIGLAMMSFRTRRARAVPMPRTDSPRPLSGVRAVIDQSIGMYLVRRLLGGSTGPSADAPASDTTSLTADEIAYRIRLRAAVAPVRDAEGAPSATVTAPAVGLARPPAPRTAPFASRERLARDTGFALATLMAIALVAFLVWPAGDPGPQPAATNLDVAGASETPEMSASPIPEPTAIVGAGESPGGSVAAETFEPSAAATPAGASTPRATPRSTPRPTPRGASNPTPTPRLTATPLATVSPTPEPSATLAPTPSPTPEPTPTREPTPEPTPAPTPEPTPSASP